MASNTFTGTGASATGTTVITDQKLTKVNVNNLGTNYTSDLVTVGGTHTTTPKVIGIVSEGKVVKYIVIDEGTGVMSASVTVTEVTSTVSFEFNAELGTVSIEPSDNEGRIKIIGVLTITDDAVHPITG